MSTVLVEPCSFLSEHGPSVGFEARGVCKLMTLVTVVNTATRKVLLGRKARGFGSGKWNGFGGKVESSDASLHAAAARELHEESGLCSDRLSHVGVLFFQYPASFEPRILEVHLFCCDLSQCSGAVTCSEEMNPIAFFAESEVPYQEMWPDDPIWLPGMLQSLFQGCPKAGSDCLDAGGEGVGNAAPPVGATPFVGLVRFDTPEHIGEYRMVPLRCHELEAISSGHHWGNTNTKK